MFKNRYSEPTSVSYPFAFWYSTYPVRSCGTLVSHLTSVGSIHLISGKERTTG